MDYTSLEEQGRKFWRKDRDRDGEWTIEEVHEAVKTYKPRFVILPPTFPESLRQRLFVTDPEISGWSRRPKVIYRSDYDNILYLYNYLFATRSLGEWRTILDGLRKSKVPGDQEAAAAIEQALKGKDGLSIDQASETDMFDVILADPDDWIERIERIEEGL